VGRWAAPNGEEGRDSASHGGLGAARATGCRPAGWTACVAACEAEPIQFRSGRISWARLLKRVFDIDMHTCPNCGGGELKIIAAILERPVIEKILTHLGLDPQPPPRGRAREVVQD
jgi:hypothetical protein